MDACALAHKVVSNGLEDAPLPLLGVLFLLGVKLLLRAFELIIQLQVVQLVSVLLAQPKH